MDAAAPRKPFLVMNPRSGGGKVDRFALRQKAERLGATVVVLDDVRRDLTELLREAVDGGADLIGAAGGDGTLGITALVAVTCNVPFLVIPAGTRNHFAMDLGLDRLRPYRALDALTDGEERAVDLGMVNGRPFVNTVSFGAYAEIVERPDYRDDKLRVTLEALPGVFAGHRHDPFTVRTDALTVADPSAALVSNNPYDTDDVAGLGHRPRLDSGSLGVICVRVEPPPPPPQLRQQLRTNPPVLVTTATAVVIEAAQPRIVSAIDGESVTLDVPVECTLLAGALRVRVPRPPHDHLRPPILRRP